MQSLRCPTQDMQQALAARRASRSDGLRAPSPEFGQAGRWWGLHELLGGYANCPF